MYLKIGHPRALYSLCLAEIGERFSFHAMRGIFVLYMTKIFLFSNQTVYAIFAAFTAFLYFTPLVGGYLADQLLGTRKSVILGGLLLSLGYFLLALLGKNNFYYALAIIVIGNGFFMPNIVSCVGQIYQKDNLLRESGFSIFYTAINIGAFLPPFIIAWIIYQFGWHASFIISGVGALFATVVFYVCANRFPDVEKKPCVILEKRKKIKVFFLLSIGMLASIFAFCKLIENPHFANEILFVTSMLFIIYAVKKSFTFPSWQRNRLLICFILTGFSILFWMLSEQTAMSLAIYTEYNVQRHIGNYFIPTVFFFSLNPFFIIILGPLFSRLWIWLEQKNLNPSISAKFALGTILMGIGFVILPLAILLKNGDGQINLWWIVLSYLIQSCGELLFSPVGLSMMTELSPKRMVGLMVGIWYLATAIAYSLAGFASKLTIIPSGVNFPLETSPIYAQIFGMLGWLTIMAGVIILLFVPVFRKMMGEKIDEPFCEGVENVRVVQMNS